MSNYLKQLVDELGEKMKRLNSKLKTVANPNAKSQADLPVKKAPKNRSN